MDRENRSNQLVSGHKILHSVKDVRESNLKLKHISGERINAAKYNSAFAKMNEVVRFLPTEDSKDDEKIYSMNVHIVKCQISQYTAIFKYQKYICKEKQPRQKSRVSKYYLIATTLKKYHSLSVEKKLLMQPYLCTKI